MKIVGLTGGIGAGKTTIAHFFNELGIPIYNSDNSAKKLMIENQALRTNIINLLGNDAYIDRQLNKPYISAQIFSNPTKLAQLNALVHPAVGIDFELFCRQNHNAPYVIKEAAILFESKAYLTCNIIIVVTASEEVRIQRIRERDQLSIDEIKKRMAAQLSEEEKIARANYVIYNNNSLQTIKKEVQLIHEAIIKA